MIRRPPRSTHCISSAASDVYKRQEEDFFYFLNVFSLFRNYLPLEKCGALHLNKLQSPSPKDALCQVWLQLAQWFWRRRWKCEKFTDGRTDGQMDRQTTDNRGSEKLTWAFSSGELKKTSMGKQFKIKWIIIDINCYQLIIGIIYLISIQ